MPAESVDAKAIQAQIALVRKLEASLPDLGAIYYFLAAATEQLHDSTGALDLLKKCLALQEGFDPSADPAFLEFEGSQEFQTMIEKVHREYPPAYAARLAFRAEEKDIIPEGLEYDAPRDVFYLSSLNRRKIVEIGRDGTVSDFVPENRYGLLPVLGIRVDLRDDTIWADSFSDRGQSELLHFDGSGKLLGRYGPQGTAKHGFNDLVVLKKGEVLTTDSLANQVLEFSPGTHTFKELAVHRPLFYPNGIAVSGDELSVYVADSLGVIRIDLTSGKSADVDPGPRSTLAGIDGLYWYKGSLIGVQNGIGAPRIALFRFSADGLHIVRTTVLENRSRFTMSPTTGAIRGSDFYFIANSPVDDLNDNKVMDTTRLEPVRIGVIHLP
ncbi:MAG TPA: hypothetical protein VJN93_15815 [Candidatus Acidoferrum sp.]|nr:hypothetical protein [Candidatus Acidoferrum sp.]